MHTCVHIRVPVAGGEGGGIVVGVQPVFNPDDLYLGICTSVDCEMTQHKILSLPKSMKLNRKEVSLVFKYLRSLNQPPILLQRIKNKIARIFSSKQNAWK